MNVLSWRDDLTKAIDLAREPDFELGAARVSPSTVEVASGALRIRLQPRIMQVLVALARNADRVVSRDELTALCWGGLVVGEDSLNRCIQRLRRLGEEIPGSFAVETLNRVGYRLLTCPPPDAAGTAGPRAASAPASFDAPPEGSSPPSSGAPPREPPPSAAQDRERPVAPVRSGEDPDAAGKPVRAQFTTALEGQDHAVVWSARFTRPVAEEDALEEQVAAKVADVLQCALGTSGGGRQSLPRKAAEAYLRACDLLRDEGARDQVRDLLRQVVAAAPKASVAWGHLAHIEALAAEEMPPEQAGRAREEARDAARTALRLNPNNGLGYAALAVAGGGEHTWLQTYELHQKGLAVDPTNPEVLEAEACLLTIAGRIEDALVVARRAAALDPLDAKKQLALAYALIEAGRIKQAQQTIERGRRVWPDEEGWGLAAVGIDLRYSDPRKAMATLEASPVNLTDARRDSFRRLLKAREDRQGAGRAAYVRQELADFRSGRLQRSQAFLDLTTVGAVDAAYEVAASTAVRPGGRGAEDLDPENLWRPFAEAFRRDPRFMTVAARLGLTDFWRATGKWPDFCSVPNPPYDCGKVAAALPRLQGRRPVTPASRRG